MLELAQLRAVAAAFDFEGRVERIEYPYGEGHINDTALLWVGAERGGPRRFIIQRINRYVFKEPQRVMDNLAGVTAHLRAKIAAAGGDPERETLTVWPTRAGEACHVDAEGEFWRAFAFIEGSVTLQRARTLEEFTTVAKSFGRFLLQLSDYPVEELHETIPNFHHTPSRYRNFVASLKADRCGRAALCREESRFLLAREADCRVLVEQSEAGLLPLRVTHNDTKINNVLLDEKTGEGLCVIDLDTVMPGLTAHDIGDAIRFGASTAAEDEVNLSRVNFDFERYKAYVEAFLSVVGEELSAPERESLAWGARLLTLETALRFLGDFLDGDVYFHVSHPSHNLERARNQIKLLQGMEARWEDMLAVVGARGAEGARKKPS